MDKEHTIGRHSTYIPIPFTCKSRFKTFSLKVNHFRYLDGEGHTYYLILFMLEEEMLGCSTVQKVNGNRFRKPHICKISNMYFKILFGHSVTPRPDLKTLNENSKEAADWHAHLAGAFRRYLSG